MSASGIVITLVGIWVVAQVTAGNALARLGIVEGSMADLPADAQPLAPNVDPKTGVPNTNPNLPYMRDPNGRVY